MEQKHTDVCPLNYQVWFLGENANYAASEYAWESATPPGTALMMLDADKMVAAASSRNPTLASALTRLQRCAFSGSWEVGPFAEDNSFCSCFGKKLFLCVFSHLTVELVDPHCCCASSNDHCNKVWRTL